MKKIFTTIGYLFLAANAFCFTTKVTTVQEVNSEMRSAEAGDTIVLADGVYKDQAIVAKAIGSAENPVVLMAETAGNVFFEGKSSLRIGGEFVEVSGFVFRKGYGNDVVQFRTKVGEVANNCRLTNCVLDGYNNPNDTEKERWVMLYGKNNRIDHCRFVNKVNEGVLIAVALEEKKNDEASRLVNSGSHKIDHNYFGNRPALRHVDNGGEIIRIGDSNTSLLSADCLVENNLFVHCDGEVEIVSVKSCNNILRGNYFFESAGALVLRHGNNNLVENNVFVGNDKRNTGGVRVINSGHIVRNNYFETLAGKGSYSAFSVMNALENPAANEYHKVENVKIENNTFVECAFVTFNLRHSSKNRAVVQVVQPENVLFAGNKFYNKRNELEFVLQDGIDGIKGFTFAENTQNGKFWIENKAAVFEISKKMPRPTTPEKPENVGVSYK